jgi:hypothetical protein
MIRSEAEFLDEIQTKILRVFLLAIHSHLYSFALRFYFFKLTQPLTVSTIQLLYVHCKGERRRKEENLTENQTFSLWFQKSAQKPQA